MNAIDPPNLPACSKAYERPIERLPYAGRLSTEVKRSVASHDGEK
jgi:hypothetical protein